MKTEIKKLVLWSSFGSIACGAAVALVRRSRAMPGRPLSCRKIPRSCHTINIWTERFELEVQESRFFAHDRYSLQPTLFRVWSILDLPPGCASKGTNPAGAAVYHVTHSRTLEAAEADSGVQEDRMLDRFYGLVTAVDPDGSVCASGSVARGGILEIRKCYVGGASNGIESGEIHRSWAPILNYRIEYDAV
jgi:hypothetical protein